MCLWPRLVISVVAVGAGLLAVSAGSQHVRIKDAGAVEAEAVVVDLSLGLFSDLARVKASDSAMVDRLLSADPRDPSKVLQPLGIDYEAFRKQISEGAGARPLVLFLRHGADPVEEARRRGITIVPWPPQAPPALLAGRDLDTLIVFESLTTSLRPRPGTAARPFPFLLGPEPCAY